MNTPTHCTDCGALFALGRMTRDAEGYFHCPSCERRRVEQARAAIERLRGLDPPRAKP